MIIAIKNEFLPYYMRKLQTKLKNIKYNNGPKYTGEHTKLHDIYFLLYDSFMAMKINIDPNYFLSIFIGYFKNTNTFLYKTLNKNANTKITMIKTFTENQIIIKQLDILMQTERDIDLIKKKCNDLKGNLVYVHDSIEREIIQDTYKDLMKLFGNQKTETIIFSRTNEKLNEILNNTFNLVKEYISQIELENKITEIIEPEAFCISKNKVDDNINTFQKLVKDVFQEHRIGTLKNKKHYFSFIIDDEIVFNDEDEIFINLFEALKISFETELYFKCFSNQNSKRKLKSRIQNKNKKHDAFQTNFFRKYHLLTQNTNSNLSYIPPIILGNEMGLDINDTKNLCDQYYKNKIKENEFNNNFNKFSNIIYNRDVVEKRFTNLKVVDFTPDEILTTNIKNKDGHIVEEFYCYVKYYINKNNLIYEDNHIFSEDPDFNKYNLLHCEEKIIDFFECINVKI